MFEVQIVVEDASGLYVQRIALFHFPIHSRLWELVVEALIICFFLFVPDGDIHSNIAAFPSHCDMLPHSDGVVSRVYRPLWPQRGRPQETANDRLEKVTSSVHKQNANYEVLKCQIWGFRLYVARLSILIQISSQLIVLPSMSRIVASLLFNFLSKLVGNMN